MNGSVAMVTVWYACSWALRPSEPGLTGNKVLVVGRRRVGTWFCRLDYQVCRKRVISSRIH